MRQEGKAPKSKRLKTPFFTLIELLVVIAITAILASMLLPALARSRYAARNVLCIGQLKQLSIAWMNYADDYDEFWPDYGEPTPNATKDSDGDRGQSMLLATKGKGDLRPILREYIGAPLNDMMVCPLASPSWISGTNSSGGHFAQHFDIDGYGMGGFGIVKSTYQLYPTGHSRSKYFRTTKQMRRVGDSFIPKDGTAVNKEFHVLLSDVVMEEYSQKILSTQRPLNSSVEEGGNYQNIATAWLLPLGVYSTANYAQDDGSINHYNRVEYYSKKNGSFLYTRSGGDGPRTYLPADLAE